MTDASGNHYLDMTFIKSDEPRPYSVLAEARVMDVNNQAWAATTSLLVHPGRAVRRASFGGDVCGAG